VNKAAKKDGTSRTERNTQPGNREKREKEREKGTKK